MARMVYGKMLDKGGQIITVGFLIKLTQSHPRLLLLVILEVKFKFNFITKGIINTTIHFTNYC